MTEHQKPYLNHPELTEGFKEYGYPSFSVMREEAKRYMFEDNLLAYFSSSSEFTMFQPMDDVQREISIQNRIDTMDAAMKFVINGPEENDLGKDEDEIRKFGESAIKRFYTAKMIAAENDVNEEQVFLDDELYLQLVRRSQKPEDFVEEVESAFPGVWEIYGDILSGEISKDELIEFLDDGLYTDGEIREIADGIMMHGNYPEQLEKAEREHNRVTQAYAYTGVKRYWGEREAQKYL